MKNLENMVNEIHEHNEKARIKTDGKFDKNKRYVFCYDKLINDDRIGIGKNTWIETLKQFDCRSVIVSSENEGIIEGTMWSIAEVWCSEVV